MAVLPAANGFEGGTSGVAITAANSGGGSGTAFDAVTTTSTTLGAYSTAQTMHGTMSATWNYTGTASAAKIQWSGFNNATLYGRFYLRFTAAPVGTLCNHVLIQDTAAAKSCGLVVQTTGTLQFTNAASSNIAATLSTTVLSATTWYRVEWAVTTGASTGTCQWWLYLGDSQTLTETKSATAQAFTANNLGQVHYGNPLGPTTYQYWLDDIQVNATGVPGPTPLPPSERRFLQAVNRAGTY